MTTFGFKHRKLMSLEYFGDVSPSRKRLVLRGPRGPPISPKKAACAVSRDQHRPENMHVRSRRQCAEKRLSKYSMYVRLVATYQNVCLNVERGLVCFFHSCREPLSVLMLHDINHFGIFIISHCRTRAMQRWVAHPELIKLGQRAE